MGIVLYNTEHYGGLLNMIAIRCKYHKNDRAVLLLRYKDGMGEFHNQLIQNGLFEKIIVHREKLGKERNDVSSKIVSYYDSLLNQNGFCAQDFQKIYTGRDCDNTFGVYLILKKVNQTVVELVRGQFSWKGTYNTSCVAGRAS